MSNQETNAAGQMGLASGAGAASEGTGGSRDQHAGRPGPAFSGAALARTGSRWSLAVPAAVLTLASYFAMNGLISVEFKEPVAAEKRILVAVTPSEDVIETPRTGRKPPVPLEAADQPPPPPKLTMLKGDIGLPTPNIHGQAPERLDFGRIESLAMDAVVISDVDARPISPPAPVYPREAAARGLEGSCEVSFHVSIRGEPFNIQATCTDRVFVRSAEQAVSRVRFAPKIVRGQPSERHNVVYPIEYGLDG